MIDEELPSSTGNCIYQVEQDLHGDNSPPYVFVNGKFSTWESIERAESVFNQIVEAEPAILYHGGRDSAKVKFESIEGWDESLVLGRPNEREDGPAFAIGRIKSSVVYLRFGYTSPRDRTSCGENRVEGCSIAPQDLAQWMNTDLMPEVGMRIRSRSE
ncbi:hypothetical protein [Salininema proteolyticum]|uniref:Uncharacterized protein n=1 Tax=Salininema proteolyticum TaxID=1607685 RepID=A0ABV8U0U9_9ACTN